jgi:hypothetical protein
MIVQKSAADIGEHGYSHWSHKPVTPGVHSVCLVPQSIADGWEAYCSCGEWRCFISFYEIASKDGLIVKLKSQHRLHCQEAGEKPHSSSGQMAVS